ncbi:MAG TPA: serine protease [Bacteriovoracaceae bacterium]|nr:serine protease [Bacteriovoracaceae bacterium]
MKILSGMVILFTLTSAFAENSEINLIYGQDNRRDVYEVRSSSYLKLAKSTAGLISLNQLSRGSDQFHLDLSNPQTLERARNICASERFSQQLKAPNCTGFLVGPDTMVTAGHCFSGANSPEFVCKTSAFLFDYDMKSPSHDPSKNILAENVYRCKQVFVRYDSGVDFAVVKLDRKVTNRSPLKFRTSGIVDSRTSLVVMGHPSGLPMKISDSGRVVKNDEPLRFSTTLDTFHGNSGSPVFDARTGLLEGILIEGKPDYLPSRIDDPKSCQVVNRCDDDAKNCLMDYKIDTPTKAGEVVFRITAIARVIQQVLSAP